MSRFCSELREVKFFSHGTINSINKTSRGIHIAHLNVRSIANKCAVIYNLILDMNISVLSVNETWLNNLTSNEYLGFLGFKIFRLDRDSRGGGVMLLIRNKFNAVLENTLSNASIELLHVSISFPNSADLNIVSIYRPPSSSSVDFISSFDRFLSNINYVDSQFILMGDFNINSLNRSVSGFRHYNRLIKSYGFTILNSEPTRVTLNTSTCLDHVLCNALARPFIDKINTVPCHISDHDLLSFFI